MKLEVMLSVMNLKKSNLDKMNITSKCTVINQCGKNKQEKYKNFTIYSYNEIGTANSRNRGLEHITEDIILICDDDVIYKDTYESNVLNEFKNNPQADIIIFNIDSPNRKIRINKRNKKLHFYNILSYSAQRIAFKKSSIQDIKFNNLFGGGAKYSSGEDTLFLVDSLNKKLNIYASTKNLGVVKHDKSTWFKGYNEKFFYDKGALFTAISYRLRNMLMLQYLLRHKEVLTNYKLKEAYKIMKRGSKDYIKTIKEDVNDKFNNSSN